MVRQGSIMNVPKVSILVGSYGHLVAAAADQAKIACMLESTTNPLGSTTERALARRLFSLLGQRRKVRAAGPGVTRCHEGVLQRDIVVLRSSGGGVRHFVVPRGSKRSCRERRGGHRPSRKCQPTSARKRSRSIRTHMAQLED